MLSKKYTAVYSVVVFVFVLATAFVDSHYDLHIFESAGVLIGHGVDTVKSVLPTGAE